MRNLSRARAGDAAKNEQPYIAFYYCIAAVDERRRARRKGRAIALVDAAPVTSHIAREIGGHMNFLLRAENEVARLLSYSLFCRLAREKTSLVVVWRRVQEEERERVEEEEENQATMPVD